MRHRGHNLGIFTLAVIAVGFRQDLALAADGPDASASTPGGRELSSGQVVLEEVVVTANRRKEDIQAVPMTVEAVSGTQLSAVGIQNLQDVGVAVAGLDVQNANGYATPYLRGVGSSAAGPGIESPIAIYVDGVYYGAATGSLFSLNNIAQIEVLKGPQGTLFGRNATGGVIQVTTRDPANIPGLEASIGYGNYGTTNAGLYVTGGVTHDLAANLAVQYTTQGDGYGHDLTTGEEVYRTVRDLSLMSKWLLTLSDTGRMTLSTDYENSYTSQIATRLIAGTAVAPLTGPAYGGSPWNVAGIQPYGATQSGGVSLRYDQKLPFAQLQSISAYRDTEFSKALDLDGTAAPFESAYVRQHDTQVSQEIHLLSSPGSAIQWLGGVYYFYARGAYAPVLLTLSDDPAYNPAYPLGQAAIDSLQSTRSIAGFGQITVELMPATHLTLGARYTSEKRDITGDESAFLVGGIPLGTLATEQASERFSRATYRVALDHSFSTTVSGFASFNSGFKSGGFEPSVLTAPPFRPETLDAYEAGLKTEWLQRRLRLNASGFYYNYKDIQVEQLQSGAINIINGAGAHVYGADVDTELRVTDRLRLSSSMEYLHAFYTSFADAPIGFPGGGIEVVQGSAAGHRLPMSPNFAGNIAVSYATPVSYGSLDLSLLYAYNSGFYEEPDNIIRQGDYNSLNASLKWRWPSGFSVAIWGRNLADAAVFTYAATLQDGNEVASYAPPRTFGFTAAYTH